MTLYMDVGNSRIKWCVTEDEEAMHASTVIELEAQWQAYSGVHVGQIVACNVRGDGVAKALDDIAEAIFGVEVRWQLSSAKACGVTNAYASPGDLGADRWLALIAARAAFASSACIVIDAGTAITVDLLDRHGQHRGGVIMPGVSLMLKALGNTAQLAPDHHGALLNTNALAVSTQAAIINGVSFSVLAGLNAVIEQQAEQLNVKINTIPIIVTGGDAPMIQLNAKQVDYRPMLVLDGLKVISECSR